MTAAPNLSHSCGCHLCTAIYPAPAPDPMPHILDPLPAWFGTLRRLLGGGR